MRVEVPYRDGRVSASFPESAHVTVLEPNKVTGRDEAELLRNAMSNPADSPALSDFLSERDEVLVVVNDATRQTPTSKALAVIEEVIGSKRPHFLVATGSHRGPTEEELRLMFGDLLAKYSNAIESHDAKESEMVSLGTTSRGTPVRVNRRLLDFDRVVLINSVEPHYFAGFTGGRKSILPGVSSYETIETNHRWALEPEAQSLALEGNPVHEDMIEAVRFLDLDRLFSLNLVLDGQRRTNFVGAGDILESFTRAVVHSRDINCVEVDAQADITITAASRPSDISLYQSQKALDNAKLVTKKGGTIILVSECSEGIGKREFFDQLAAEERPEDVIGKLRSGYRLGWHKAAKMAEMSLDFRILSLTSLPPDDMKSIFMEPFEDFQSAVNVAIEGNRDAHVAVMPMGERTVPRVR